MNSKVAALARASCIRHWLSAHRLASIMLLGLLLGAACMAVVPPWWHYDEPGHFEYAWLAAHSPTWPVEGQYDQSMRKQMAQSMLRYDWYSIRNYEPNFKSSEPIPIGVTQVGDQPGYYFLASLPLRLMPDADMTVQYYAAHSVSLVLFLFIILAAWYALGEILPGHSPLRWMATVFIAALPAFVDEMVSVNNDVSAVLAATLAIWACLRLIQKGYSLGRLVFVAASLVACYLSKSTALFAFALAPIALVLALLRGRYARLVWGAAALVLLALAAITLTWGAPLAWYNAAGSGAARVQQQDAPLGTHAFRLDDSIPGGSSQLMQIIPPDVLDSLKGRTATLGAWLWADQPTQAGPFYVAFTTRSDLAVTSPQTLLDVTTVPVFHQFTFGVPGDALNATLYIDQTSHALPQNSVFLDGLVLVPGGFPTGVPKFAERGMQISFGGRLMPNLVRNPSAEQGSFQVRTSIDARTSGILSRVGISLGATLAMLQDWSGAGWFYRGSLDTLFRTFWTSLAGDKVVLPGPWVNVLLLLLTVLGVLGALVRLWTRRKSLRWDVLGWLLIALALPWLLALIRGSGDVLRGNFLYPWARYAFPAILPTALLLCAGWLECLEHLAFRFKLSLLARDAIFFAIMLGISLLAIFNAVRIFHPAWWAGGISPVLFVILLVLVFYIYLTSASRAEPSATA